MQQVAMQIGPSQVKRLNSSPPCTLKIVSKRTRPAGRVLKPNSRQVKDLRILVVTYLKEKEGPLRLLSPQQRSYSRTSQGGQKLVQQPAIRGPPVPIIKALGCKVFNKLSSEHKAAVSKELGGCRRCSAPPVHCGAPPSPTRREIARRSISIHTQERVPEIRHLLRSTTQQSTQCGTACI